MEWERIFDMLSEAEPGETGIEQQGLCLIWYRGYVIGAKGVRQRSLDDIGDQVSFHVE